MFLLSIRLYTCMAVLGLAAMPLAGSAQTVPLSGPLFRGVSHAAVEKGTRQLSAPFAGGMSAPQFAQADLNRDGLLDLVVFESYSGNIDVRTFRNEGTAGTPKYVYAPQYENNFVNVVGASRFANQTSDVYSYVRLLDYNCDGIPDLFTGGFPGVKVSRGAYNSRNELYFTYYKALYYPSASGPVNVYVSGSDLPGIADVDGDGDLDLVTYAAAGSRMEYYRNYRVERGLSCDSIQIELETSCWGRSLQGINRELYTRMTPTCAAQNPPFWNPGSQPGPVYVPADPATAGKTTAHGSNTLCLLDIDADGDMDILNSSESYDDMQLQINGRKDVQNRLVDSIVAQDTLWKTNDKIAALHSFPAAYYIDYDADGKKDILIAPHFSNPVSKDNNQVLWYRNVGTTTVPNFQFQKDSLLCEDMIDGGSNSHPLFYDFNKDGKPDILMGSTATDVNGKQQNRLSYYQNISSQPGSPKYRFITATLARVDTLKSLGCAPAVGDIDGDGKDDLVIGLQSGYLAYYRNTAVSNLVEPIWELAQATLTSPGGVQPHVSGYATPFIRDLNSDGRPDVLCGSNSGLLAAFLNNTAVQGTPTFAALLDSLGGVLIDSASGSRNSTVFVGAADSTGETYLIMGSNSGNLRAWKFPDTAVLTAHYVPANGNLPFLQSPGMSAPAVADMDGDGRLELILGSKWGGLSMYWTGPAPADIPGVNPIAGVPVIIFPNPATEKLTIRRQPNDSATDLKLVLRNLLGQVVQMENLPAGSVEMQLEVQALPAGMYMVSVQNSAGLWTAKVQIMH